MSMELSYKIYNVGVLPSDPKKYIETFHGTPTELRKRLRELQSGYAEQGDDVLTHTLKDGVIECFIPGVDFSHKAFQE